MLTILTFFTGSFRLDRPARKHWHFIIDNRSRTVSVYSGQPKQLVHTWLEILDQSIINNYLLVVLVRVTESEVLSLFKLYGIIAECSDNTIKPHLQARSLPEPYYINKQYFCFSWGLNPCHYHG